MNPADKSIPYWQRQGYTPQGWKSHREAVQRWKKRNPEKDRAHSAAYHLREKKRYGDRRRRSDVAFLNWAVEQNKKIGLDK